MTELNLVRRSGDPVERAIMVANRHAELAQYPITPADAVSVTGGLVVVIGMIAFAYKKLRKTGAMDDAEGMLYTRMSERISKLEMLLDQIATENKVLIVENADLKSRIGLLEHQDSDLTRLKETLDKKDDRISDLEIALNLKEEEISELRARVNQLELRYAEKCDACELRVQ